MDKLNLPSFVFDIQTQGQKKHIFDTFRKKFVTLSPEEWVRQHWLRYLVDFKEVPKGLIAVETLVKLNGMNKRADVVVYGKTHKPHLIIECKAPNVEITSAVCWQIASYNFVLHAPLLIVSNGITHYVFYCDMEAQQIKAISELPSFKEWA